MHGLYLSVSFPPLQDQPQNSTSWKNVLSALRGTTRDSFEGLDDMVQLDSLWGVSKVRVGEVWETFIAAQKESPRLSGLREKLTDLPNNELAALAHKVNIEGLNKTLSHLIADRNKQNQYYGSDVFDREKRREKYQRNIMVRKELGASMDDVQDFYNNFKFFPTITPHPTKDKNDLADKLYRSVLRLFDNKTGSDLQEGLQDYNDKALYNRLTPDKKDDYTKETDFALESEREILRGQLNWIEDEQDALNAVYGYGEINFMSSKIHMDIATRRWHGGDADGKPVPAASLFALRVKGTHIDIKEYLDILEGHDELAEQRAVFESFKEKLDVLYNDIENIEKLKSYDSKFDEVKKDFGKVFTETQYKGKFFSTGPELTRALKKDLQKKSDEMLRNGSNVTAGKAARRVVLMHDQVGISVGRQEVRHNGDDYKKIFDNLFEYLKENEIIELPNVMLGKDGKKFSGFTADEQAVLLKRVMEEHSQDMKQWLYEANPSNSKDEKKHWSREILERFDVMHKCFNHDKMGFGIIAEADASSAVLQQVLAESFGIKNMTHCPLNEEEHTIRDAAKALGKYSEVFGAQNLAAKVQKADSEGVDVAPLFFAVMDPQSDSQKSYGLNIKWLQRATDKELIDFSVTPFAEKTGCLNLDQSTNAALIAVLRKIGTGASTARGGFSPKIVPRLFINALSDAGYDLDNIDDDLKPVLKQMVSFVSTTIQGRDVAMRMGTEESVQDLMQDVAAECQIACLTIDGHLKNTSEKIYKVAPQYSDKMRDAIEKRSQEARDQYQEMRTDTIKTSDNSEFGRPFVDVYIEKVSAAKMAEFTNVGARPDVRSESEEFAQAVSLKPTTKQRAIGSNNALENSESCFDSIYTLGYFLSGIHKDYREGRISLEDISLMKNDPFFMEQMLPNAMTAAAFADYEYGFDMLDGEKKWDVEALIEAKKNNWKGLDKITRFHARLAYDAVLATASLEALQNPPTLISSTLSNIFDNAARGFDLNEEEMIYKIYNKNDRLNKLKFGKKTMKAFSDIKDVQKHKEEVLTARALLHETERRVFLTNTDPDNEKAIDPNTTKGKSFLHHVACSVRTASQKNLEVLLDHTGFQSNNVPVYDRVLELKPEILRRLNKKVANDNKGLDGPERRVA